MLKTEINQIQSDDWLPVDENVAYIAGKSDRVFMSYWSDVWRRFKQNKLSLFGIVIIILLILIAVFGPLSTNTSYSDQNRDQCLIPPMLSLYELENNSFIYISPSMNIYDTTEKGEILNLVTIEKDDIFTKSKMFSLGGKSYLFDYSQKPYILTSQNKSYSITKKHIMNKNNPLGTDSLGRDLWIRLMYGARISLIVGLVSSIVNLTMGVVYGGISAFAGGWIDNLMMRFVDILRSSCVAIPSATSWAFVSGLRTSCISI